MFYDSNFFDIDRKLFFLVIIFSGINSLSTIFTTTFQLEKKAIKFAIFTLITSIFSTVLGIALVYYTGSVYGRIIAPIIIAFLVLIILFIDFDKSKVVSSISFRQSIRQFYKKGLPLVVGLVLSWGLEKIDRFMISEMISIEDLGIYGVGYKFGMIILFVQCAISRTWLPFLLEHFKDKGYVKRTINKISLFLLGLTIVTSIASFFYIQFFIDSKFDSAGWIAVVVSFGYCLDGIWKLFNGILIYENKYKFYTILVGIAGVSNVIVNYFAIPRWGIMGAALATLVAFAMGMMFNWYYVKFRLKWFKVKYE